MRLCFIYFCILKNNKIFIWSYYSLVMIIGVTGSFCGGKDTAAEYLAEKGFKHISLSDMIREECKKRKRKVTRDNLQEIGKDLREKYGNSVLAEKALDKVKGKDCVVTSIRHPDEIDVLQRNADFTLIKVEAPAKTRFKRMKLRNREEDPQTFREFKKTEKKEMKGKGSGQRLKECNDKAKIVLINNSSLEVLKQKVDKLVEDLRDKEKKDQDEKRKDYISWDDYFMGVAKLSALRSKDPNTQVGACIVNQQKKIVGIGYNGFPIGCSDEKLPWGKKGNFLDTKYPYVAHAELNAILNSTVKLDNCKIYVALFPCNECCKLIIQSGIKEVIYLSNKYADSDVVKASKRMMDMAGIRHRKYKPKEKRISIDLTDI
ncbi:AAA family ATPase [Candidatus Woesearchaeota archaeon]|nr:AAA family ATPase [Candidatus Woesearchaeota archaeon]